MIKFKTRKVRNLFFDMHPLLQLIAIDSALWAYERGLVYVLTETVTTTAEDKILGRVSKSHSDKRAYDARSKNWSLRDKIEYKEYITSKYGIHGALSHSGKVRLVVHHDSGHGEHFHVQLHSKFKL